MSANIFQAGRIYRTVNGELMKLESIGDGMFAGKSQGDPLKVDQWQVIYNATGVPTDSTKVSWILLPGVVDVPQQFDVGKTYRTREGRTAQVLHHHTSMLKPFHLSVNGNAVWAFADGSFETFDGSKASDIMLPGAIEDELTVKDREYSSDLAALSERQDNLEKHCEAMQNWINYAVGLPIKAIDEPQRENTAHSMRYTSASAIISEDVIKRLTVLEKLEALHNNYHIKRYDRLETRIAGDEVTPEWQKRLSKLEAAVTGVNGFQASLNALRDALHGTDHEGDNVKRRLTELEKRIDGLVLEHAERTREQSDREIARGIIPRGTFLSLLNVLGYEIGEYGRVRKKQTLDQGEIRPMTVDSAAWTGRKTPKPTLNGGWINLYKQGSVWNQWHASKPEADCAATPDRIACIQIPDFTEGEGL